jgi:hypothetical protein
LHENPMACVYLEWKWPTYIILQLCFFFTLIGYKNVPFYFECEYYFFRLNFISKKIIFHKLTHKNKNFNIIWIHNRAARTDHVGADEERVPCVLLICIYVSICIYKYEHLHVVLHIRKNCDPVSLNAKNSEQNMRMERVEEIRKNSKHQFF